MSPVSPVNPQPRPVSGRCRRCHARVLSDLAWCPQCHSPVSTVVVRTPLAVPSLVGGQVGEDRMRELMAQLSAKEPPTGPLAWARRGGGAPSLASRILLTLAGIGAVLALLLALIWLAGLFV